MIAPSRPAALMGLTAYLLSQTAKIAKHDLDALLAGREMRLRHMAMMAVLADGGPSGQLALAKALALDPSDITSTVDDLEGFGFVVRQVDRADRRRRVVSLTTAGQRCLTELVGLAEEVTDVMLAPIPAAGREALRRDLRLILANRDADRATATAGARPAGRSPSTS